MKNLITVILLLLSVSVLAQKNSLSIDTGYLINTSAEKFIGKTLLNRRSSDNFYSKKDGFRLGATVSRQIKKGQISLSSGYVNQGFVFSDSDEIHENITSLGIIQSTVSYSFPFVKKLRLNLGVGNSYIASINSKDRLDGQVVAENLLYFGGIKEGSAKSIDIRRNVLNASAGFSCKVKKFDIKLIHHFATTYSIDAMPNNIFLSNVEVGISYQLFKF